MSVDVDLAFGYAAGLDEAGYGEAAECLRDMAREVDRLRAQLAEVEAERDHAVTRWQAKAGDARRERDEAVARAEAAEAETARLRDLLRGEREKRDEEVDRLANDLASDWKARVDALTEALRFYAQRENYDWRCTGLAPLGRVQEDRGSCARTALAAVEAPAEEKRP